MRDAERRMSAPGNRATVEAVEFGMSFHGSTIKVIVLACDLQELFGAGRDPVQWLATFEANKHSIRRAARRRFQVSAAGPLIVQRADLEAAQ